MLDDTVVILVTVVEGSGTCIPGCTLVPPNGRFLYPFETTKDMSPFTTKDTKGRSLSSSLSVVNIILDMVNTSELVDPAFFFLKSSKLIR